MSHDLKGFVRLAVLGVGLGLPVSREMVWAAPPNDGVADRIRVEGEQFEISGRLDGATVEQRVQLPGTDKTWSEPTLWFLSNFCEVDPRYRESGSVWYEWVAPRSGTVVLMPSGRWTSTELLPCEPALVCFRPRQPVPGEWVDFGLSDFDFVSFCRRNIQTARYPYGSFYAEAGKVYLFQVYGTGGKDFRFRCTMTHGPLIVEQPIDRDLLTNETSFLSVVATGSPVHSDPVTSPIRYRWFRDSALLEGQTNSTLLLNASDQLKLEHYHVVVTDLEGSLTSRVVRVEVKANELAPKLSLFRREAASTEWVCKLKGERGRFYYLEFSTNLIDWDEQSVSIPEPWFDEVTVVTGGRPGQPRARLSHVQLDGEVGEFLIPSLGAHRYFRAKRMRPFYSLQSSLLWMLQYGKEDWARQNGPYRLLTDTPSSYEVAFRIPEEIRSIAFGGGAGCRADVVMDTLGSPPQWACLPTNAADWADPYMLANPSLVWRLRPVKE